MIGAEGLGPAELLAELDAGARVVAFEYVFSLVYFSYSGPKLYLVRPGRSAFKPGFDRTIFTLLAGWWSIPGLIQTPVVLVKNCMGGSDATGWVRMRCHEDLQRAAEAAQARVAMLEAPIDTPEARADRAMFFLSEGDAEGAWGLISEDVSRPDPQLADLPRLRRLLVAFHDKQAWDPALRLGVVIARAFPAEARNGYLATLLRRIEAENGVKRGTIVPPAAFWSTGRGCAVILGALTLGFVALMVWLNVWIRDHSRLHVVNGLQEEIVVSVPGATPAELRLAPGKVEQLVLPEGDHRARIVRAGGSESLIDVPLRRGALERFSGGIRILNPEGAAVLVRVQAGYAEAGSTPPHTDPPQVHVGEPYAAFDASEVGEPPVSVTLKRGEVTVLTRVVVLRGHPVEVSHRLEEPLDYLELHARLAPGDADLLERYVEVALDGDEQDRAVKFLDEGLARPPRQAAWCLARLRLEAASGEVAIPKSLLAGDYPDPQLLALAARASADGREARSRLERVLRTAPLEPVALLGLAEQRLREGDVEGAAKVVGTAGLPDGPELRAVRQELARRASEAVLDAAHVELRNRVRRFPLDLVAGCDLLELEAIRGEPGALERASQRLHHLWARGDQADAARRFLRRARATSLGDPAELLVLDRIDPEPGLRLIAHLLREDVDEASRAAREVGPDPALALELTLLAASLAARGDERTANVVELARGAWSGRGPRGAIAAGLVDGRERTSDQDLLALTLSCHEIEAVRLLVAASQSPGEARSRIATRMPAARGQGYPAAVLRAIRSRLETRPR